MSFKQKGAAGPQALTKAEWEQRTRNTRRPYTDSATWKAEHGEEDAEPMTERTD